ncbi:MAG: hypothetical protein NT076_04590 [Candidatus Pacearchaeota archaeon]|nr:hypothetical protein [Candidatus Pacearchaeota archaeon]
MAQKSRTRIVHLYITSSTFASIFKRLRGDRSDYDFSGFQDLRQLLSKEKAKILHTIKNKNPNSIYQLAKFLARDFKAVFQDIKLLQKFGFIELQPESKGKRKRLKPVLAIDNLQVNIGFQ